MIKLIELEPVENDSKNRLTRVWEYEFINELRLEKLKDICKEKKMLKKPEIFKDSNGISYQYPNKPRIIVKDGKLFTTAQDISKFGKTQCQHQATILLRLLYYPKRKRRILRAKRSTLTFARSEFLRNAKLVNEKKTIGRLSIDLIRIGEYKPDNYYRLGFDLMITNDYSQNESVELRPNIIGSNHTRRYKLKVISLEPGESTTVCYYSSQLKDKTLNYKLEINYKIGKKKGKLDFFQ